MKPSFRTGALLLSLLGAVAARSPALAQEPLAAEALFNRGVEQMNAGNYASGCKDIAESQRLDPQPGALFTLATCMDRWGRLATAVALYGDYLAVHEKLSEERKAKQGERPNVARAQREKLGPAVPLLTLTLPPDAPAGTLVKRDGQEVSAAALGAPFPVDPGTIVVTTQAPNGPVWQERVTIGRGEKKRVALEVKAGSVIGGAPPPGGELSGSPVAPPAPERMSDRRKAAYAIGGVGIAGLVLGGVTGGLALERKGTIDEHCGEAINAPRSRCDPTGLEAGRTVKTFGWVSTIGFAVGVVGLGVGVVLFVTERARTSPKAGADGRWIAAELLSAGPCGAMIGARGAF